MRIGLLRGIAVTGLRSRATREQKEGQNQRFHRRKSFEIPRLSKGEVSPLAARQAEP
jgi:hypothetical protein